MAEVVAISLEVDSGKSVQEVKSLENAIKDVQKTTNASNVQEKFTSLNKAIDSGTGSVEDLRKAIKSYQTIALNAGRTSPIGKEALQRSADLKDKLTDLDNEVNRLAQDGKKMQGAMQIGQSVMGGYSAFIGISALAGEGSEELQKTMVKLTATMSVMQGIEQIRLATEKESQAMMFLRETKTKALTALNFLWAGSVRVVNGALKSLRGALIATGLGAVLVLIGYIISKWDDWKETIMDFIDNSLGFLIDALQYLGIVESDLEKERKKNSERQIKRLQDERDEIDKNLKQEEQQLSREIALGKARGENTDKLEKELLKIRSKASKDRLQSLKDSRREVSRLKKEGWTEEYKELTEQIDAEKQLRANAVNDIKIFDANATKEERDAWKKARDVRVADKRKEHSDEMNMLKEFERDLEDLIISNEEDEDVRRLARLELDQQRELEDLRLKYGEETGLEKELLIKQNRELQELKKEILLANKEEDTLFIEEVEGFDEIDPVIEKLKLDADNELNILKEKLKAGLILEDEYAKKTQLIYDAKHSMRVEELNNAGSISNSLASLFAKNEKIQKANALVQIGIDTAKAISSLVASSNGNPMNLVTGGLAGFAQLTTGLASIFGNIAKAKQLLSGGSVGGGAGVTPPSISAPSTDTSTINSQSNNGVGFNSSTNRVVLVESDLRMMQERRNNSDIISTI
jgi:hypothetical protein